MDPNSEELQSRSKRFRRSNEDVTEEDADTRSTAHETAVQDDLFMALYTLSDPLPFLDFKKVLKVPAVVALNVKSTKTLTSRLDSTRPGAWEGELGTIVFFKKRYFPTASMRAKMGADGATARDVVKFLSRASALKKEVSEAFKDVFSAGTGSPDKKERTAEFVMSFMNDGDSDDDDSGDIRVGNNEMGFVIKSQRGEEWAPLRVLAVQYPDSWSSMNVPSRAETILRKLALFSDCGMIDKKAFGVPDDLPDFGNGDEEGTDDDDDDDAAAAADDADEQEEGGDAGQAPVTPAPAPRTDTDWEGSELFSSPFVPQPRRRGVRITKEIPGQIYFNASDISEHCALNPYEAGNIQTMVEPWKNMLKKDGWRKSHLLTGLSNFGVEIKVFSRPSAEEGGNLVEENDTVYITLRAAEFALRRFAGGCHCWLRSASLLSPSLTSTTPSSRLAAELSSPQRLGSQVISHDLIINAMSEALGRPSDSLSVFRNAHFKRESSLNSLVVPSNDGDSDESDEFSGDLDFANILEADIPQRQAPLSVAAPTMCDYDASSLEFFQYLVSQPALSWFIATAIDTSPGAQPILDVLASARAKRGHDSRRYFMMYLKRVGFLSTSSMNRIVHESRYLAEVYGACQPNQREPSFFERSWNKLWSLEGETLGLPKIANLELLEMKNVDMFGITTWNQENNGVLVHCAQVDVRKTFGALLKDEEKAHLMIDHASTRNGTLYYMSNFDHGEMMVTLVKKDKRGESCLTIYIPAFGAANHNPNTTIPVALVDSKDSTFAYKTFAAPLIAEIDALEPFSLLDTRKPGLPPVKIKFEHFLAIDDFISCYNKFASNTFMSIGGMDQYNSTAKKDVMQLTDGKGLLVFFAPPNIDLTWADTLTPEQLKAAGMHGKPFCGAGAVEPKDSMHGPLHDGAGLFRLSMGKWCDFIEAKSKSEKLVYKFGDMFAESREKGGGGFHLQLRKNRSNMWTIGQQGGSSFFKCEGIWPIFVRILRECVAESGATAMELEAFDLYWALFRDATLVFYLEDFEKSKAAAHVPLSSYLLNCLHVNLLGPTTPTLRNHANAAWTHIHDILTVLKVAVRNVDEESSEAGVYSRRLIQHHVNCLMGQYGSESMRMERMLAAKLGYVLQDNITMPKISPKTLGIKKLLKDACARIKRTPGQSPSDMPPPGLRVPLQEPCNQLSFYGGSTSEAETVFGTHQAATADMMATVKVSLSRVKVGPVEVECDAEGCVSFWASQPLLVVKSAKGASFKVKACDLAKAAISSLVNGAQGTSARIFLQFRSEPSKFNKSTPTMLLGVPDSHLQQYSCAVLTMDGTKGPGVFSEWRDKWKRESSALEGATPVAENAGTAFDPRKHFDHSSVSAHQRTQASAKASKRRLPILDLSESALKSLLDLIKEILENFYNGTASVSCHCTFCKQKVFLKDAKPVPLWCLVDQPGEVHRFCTQKKVWGGAPVVQDELEDDDEDDDGTFEQEREREQHDEGGFGENDGDGA